MRKGGEGRGEGWEERSERVKEWEKVRDRGGEEERGGGGWGGEGEGGVVSDDGKEERKTERH